MTIKQVKEKARGLGIKNISRYRKENLIKVIQEVEGNSPCFKAIENCGESLCAWRNECQDGW
ncbi:MAG: hypothetical protein QG577_1122 [Thermodesulfobacteriota bacterium]|nr:hypothetical protein [Thermodesulfobacteriota bacterium]